MRLLFVNSAWTESWGGGEKWTVEAANWFRQHGQETTIVARPHSRLKQAAITRGLPVIETVFGGDFDPLAIGRAHAIVRQSRCELVVVNFNKEAWQFGLAAKLCGIPVAARHGFPLFKNKASHRFLKQRLITKLIVNARSILDYYRSIGFATDDIELIYNGVAIVEQKRGELRRRFDIGTDELLIVAAGRLESQKRFDRVIELAAELSRSRPSLRFLIAGDGPLQEKLQAQINSQSLQRHVKLIGFVDDFAGVIGDADLFVLTSDDEGTPNALLEAMIAGVACVSTAVGSVNELFGDELSGNAIPLDHLDLLKDQTAALLDSASLRQAVAKRMQTRARSQFSLDASMQRFEQSFQNILKQPS